MAKGKHPGNGTTPIFQGSESHWGEAVIPLNPLISAQTGLVYVRAVVSAETSPSVKLFHCEEPECESMAATLRLRVLSVLDWEGGETSINDIAVQEPALAEQIRRENSHVKICFPHLFEKFLEHEEKSGKPVEPAADEDLLQ